MDLLINLNLLRVIEEQTNREVENSTIEGLSWDWVYYQILKLNGWKLITLDQRQWEAIMFFRTWEEAPCTPTQAKHGSWVTAVEGKITVVVPQEFHQDGGTEIKEPRKFI